MKMNYCNLQLDGIDINSVVSKKINTEEDIDYFYLSSAIVKISPY